MDKKGVVWRNDIRVFILNMSNKDVSDMKKVFEKIAEQRRNFKRASYFLGALISYFAMPKLLEAIGPSPVKTFLSL